METIYEIAKICIPALIVFLTAWIIIRNMIRNDQDRRRQEQVLQSTRITMPIRLQAYERIVLFLERISLESLVVRVSKPGMSSGELHSELVSAVRSEFEHNLSQQLYMSAQAWEVVRNARSNTIKIINTEAGKMPETASGMDLGKQLLEHVMELDKEPTRAAIEFVKAEVSRII